MAKRRKHGDGSVRLRKDGRWEYRFFVDVEGNLDDAAVQNALRGVKEESAFMRVLGNFEA